MTERGLSTVSDFEHSSLPEGPPKVVNATAPTTTTVRVLFDRGMKRSNPSDPADVLNVSNYSFSVIGGVTVTALSVAKVVDYPTSVDVTVNREMTGGATYRVTVDNVESETGQLIGSDNFADFSGVAVRPSVLSVTALDGVILELEYDEFMEQTGILNPANYNIDDLDFGGAGPGIDSVDLIDNKTVWLWLDAPSIIGRNYRCYANNVTDLSNNPILGPPNNYDDFVGVDIVTKLDTVTIINETTIKLTYSKQMNKNDIIDPANYTLEALDPGAATLYISQIVAGSGTYPTECTLFISEMTDGANYKITGSPDIKDRFGFSLTPPFDTKTFEGEGLRPTVDLVVAEGKNLVKVTFSEAMKDNADLRNPAKYVFDKGLSVAEVLEVGTDFVRLSTGDQVEEELYTLTVFP